MATKSDTDHSRLTVGEKFDHVLKSIERLSLNISYLEYLVLELYDMSFDIASKRYRKVTKKVDSEIIRLVEETLSLSAISPRKEVIKTLAEYIVTFGFMSQSYELASNIAKNGGTDFILSINSEEASRLLREFNLIVNMVTCSWDNINAIELRVTDDSIKSVYHVTLNPNDKRLSFDINSSSVAPLVSVAMDIVSDSAKLSALSVFGAHAIVLLSKIAMFR